MSSISSKQLSTEERDEISSIIDNADSMLFNNTIDYSASEKTLSSNRFTEILRRHYGHKSFKPLQLKIIKALVFEKRDVLSVMATGFGKSLCFQFPAIVQSGVALVICPLIALMQDQVLSLRMVKISACLLGQGAEIGISKQDVLMGSYKICYLTPEYATNNLDFIKNLDETVGISLVAIDEAHCVSQWGHDFRPAYRKIGELKAILYKVPFIGVTATATESVRHDIISSIHLVNPLEVSSNFNRSNLYLSASYRKGFDDILSFTFKDLPSIIYCSTKKIAEKVYGSLMARGRKAALYHAGLSQDKRKQAHMDFVSDTVQIIVATIAFGMGIDKPDIGNVIHFGAPKDMESYYQEIGRGGRDGRPCVCHVLYSDQDFVLNRCFLRNNENNAYYQHRLSMIHKMEQYLRSKQCRRSQIVSHFAANEVFLCEPCSCCDNCANKCSQNTENLMDLSDDSKLVLNAIKDLNGRFGLGTCVLFLRGSTCSKVSQSMKSKVTYGMGRYKADKYWKCLVRKLIELQYVEEVKNTNCSFGGFTIRITNKSQQWLSSTDSLKEKILIDASDIIDEFATTKSRNESAASTNMSSNSDGRIILPNVIYVRQPWTGVAGKNVDKQNYKLQGQLYGELFVLRNEIALRSGIAAHRVANNKTLASIAKIRPRCISDLSKVDEFPIAKAETVGEEFIKCTQQFFEKHNWKDVEENKSDLPEITTDGVWKSAMPDNNKISYISFQIEKHSVEEIARMQNLTNATILRHIASAMQYQLPVDINRLNINEQLISDVENSIRNDPINSDITRIKPIKDAIDQSISYDQLNIIIEILRIKFGVTPLSVQTKSNEQLETTKKHLPDWISCNSPPAHTIKSQPRKRKFAL